MLGRQSLLSAGDVEKLMEARRRYFGLESTPGWRPGCPVPAEGDSAERFWVSREELMLLVDEALKKRR
jgi:hypothetical protein